MPLEEFKNLDPSVLPIGKLVSIIARNHAVYLNHNLKDFEINATQLLLLFEISHQNNLNQEKIASRCNIDKGTVARSIKKLEEKDLIIREIDSKNRRQNKVSLTSKGQKILDKSIDLFNHWEDEAFKDNDIIERETLQIVLKQIAINAIKLNQEDDMDE